DAGDLAQVGHRPGGTGVDFDDEEFVLVDQVLDVYQPLGAQGQGQLLRAVHHDLHHLIGEAVGGVDGDGVAAVDAGPLDVLHDAGHQHVGAVGDDVHLQLGAGHVFL